MIMYFARNANWRSLGQTQASFGLPSAATGSSSIFPLLHC